MPTALFLKIKCLIGSKIKSKKMIGLNQPAKIVVSGGRGIGSEENFEIVEKLAGSLVLL